MSEERLQEIKDSIEFQYTLAKAKGHENALLFTDEEQELVEEIERLHSIIKEVNKLLNTLEEINENYKVEDTDSLYSKKWLRETIEEMREVINGRNE